MQPERQIVFVPFRLDLENECVWRGTQAILLTPKAFAVLRYLVERAGRLVTKDELFQAAWPEVVVSDAVLKVCVSEIRKALRDNAKAPRFIETLHRRGYRFIAPLTTVTPPVSSSRFQVPDQKFGGSSPGSIVSDQKLKSRTVKPETYLVGRVSELAQLHSWLEKALNGERQVVFVTGEAGIGKTAVVEGFLERAAHEERLWIARGHCVEHYGTGEVYLPVLEALGRLCRMSGGERLVALLDRYAPTWLMQMPALLSSTERERLQRELLGTTRERMLREIAEALEALTAEMPVVLDIEDLQWSDYSTLDLIAFLARRWESARLLVIGTYRPVDVIVGQHPLKAVKQELQIHGQCKELPLELLTVADVAEYLTARFPGGALPEELARIIHQRTDGNPLFMVNVVEHLLTRHLIGEKDGQWELKVELADVAVGVPENIRQMIARQVERLSAEEQQVLEVASVVGAEFTAAAVAAASEEKVERIDELCEELARQSQLLRPLGVSEWPDGTVTACYGFIHTLYQNVLYQQVAVARQLRLHQQIGECLEARHGKQAKEIAAELAMHFEQGRDYRRAVQYLQQAAKNAAWRYAGREAVDYLTRALGLVKRLPEGEQVNLYPTVLEQRALVHRSVGDMQGAIEDFTALETYAREHQQGEWEVRALFYLTDEVTQVDAEQGRAIAEQAVALSGRLQDEDLQAHARGYYGYYYSIRHGWRDEDAQACAAAVEAARRAGDRALPGLHLGRYAYFQVLRSEYEAAYRTAEEGLHLALEVGDASEYLQCQFFRALALLYLGRWGEMLSILRDAVAMTKKNGHLLWAAIFQFELAWLHEQAGDFARARELCEHGLEQAQQVHYEDGQLLLLILLGQVYLGLGQDERAFHYFSESTRQFEHDCTSTEWPFQMLLSHGLSEYWLAHQEFARARQEAERLCELAAQPGERTYLALGRRTLAEIALAERKWVQAEKEVSQALAVLEGIEAPLAEWRVCATAAQFYEQRHRKTKACQYWTRSAAVLHRLADSLGDSVELRQSLLTHPSVRSILRRSGFVA